MDVEDKPATRNETLFSLYKEMLIETSKHQFEYGKWLLASLLAVHGGSLLAISQAGEAKQRLYQACGPYLIYGLASALLSGGLAWINFTAVHAIYFNFVHQVAEGRPAEAGKKAAWFSNVTFWLTPIVVAASLGLFLYAAFKATSIL
ncbi:MULTISPECIES: hypothetical protein [unclassified Rhizobium]|uniref:hypothetical protein n=1 Tax=unclassified Rhizobium TaxID=2613769 RepID=UPI00115C9791|nr:MULTISPECIES: hypothetical protein [unclassified Rhizobium]TQX88456.1 hypothetical protein EQW76_11515 [Rhizobium sp. rho-13.1]TQY12651.1 hypothetical protein EQW74_15160 [Rhizobium sp. rho-1.1]